MPNPNPIIDGGTYDPEGPSDYEIKLQEAEQVVQHAKVSITCATSLIELRDVLNRIDAACRLTGDDAQHVYDASSLPTYGGDTPEDTQDIYSWDATSLLLRDFSPWYIETRASFYHTEDTDPDPLNPQQLTPADIAARATPWVDPRTPVEAEADDRLAEAHAQIAAEHNLISVWSVNGADDLDAPHPFAGATILVYDTLSGEADGVRVWGGDGGRYAEGIGGDRWLDVWLATDKAIQRSGDLHHRYVERVERDPNVRGVLHLDCGS